ncbi:MAG: flagellar type III secretion system pore protein FliP [Candidatus Mucispirillum faecigallinarum]|nr:flagellar type III secretion system pore protein FliP [Candidatus Mucispirillum faecigallinarum]
MAKIVSKKAVKKTLIFGLFLGIAFLGFAGVSYAQNQTIPIPTFRFGVEGAETPQDVAFSLQVVFIFTILALAPSIIMVMTSFTRIIIVFSFLRTAMGTSTMPPNQILTGMALLLTFYIMTPVLTEINKNSFAPYVQEEITFKQAVEEARKPMRQFLISNTREKDLLLFIDLSRIERPKTYDEIPDLVLVAAFVMSEVQVAFQIGFLLFLPFLIIDFVISSVLLAMGMMMLPPVMISVPFKILLFVLVDGWSLLITGLVKSYVV